MMLTVTSAVEAMQGGLLVVQRNTTGPLPLLWVKVAFGVVLFGPKVPAPPLTMLHTPVPAAGVLAPKPLVVPPVQMVCVPPTAAVVDGVAVIKAVEAEALQPAPFVAVRWKVHEPGTGAFVGLCSALV